MTTREVIPKLGDGQFAYVFSDKYRGYKYDQKISTMLKRRLKNDLMLPGLLDGIRNLIKDGKKDYDIYKFIKTYIDEVHLDDLIKEIVIILENNRLIKNKEDKDRVIKDIKEGKLDKYKEYISQDESETNKEELIHRAETKVVNILPLIPSSLKIKRIMDLGCNDGSVTGELAAYYKLSKQNAVGIDLGSEKQILDKYKDKITYIQYDGKKLPETELSKGGKYSLITSFVVLHHILPEYLEGIIQSVSNLLESGGIFIVKEHNVDYKSFIPVIDIEHTLFELWSQEDIRNYFSGVHIINGHTGDYKPKTEWDAIMKKAGLYSVTNIINPRTTRVNTFEDMGYMSIYYKP